MFFMMGITDGRKDFDFHQQIICDICGKYGRFQVFMTYTVLSLFFIPCFKWNKHYLEPKLPKGLLPTGNFG